jgi:hypothetical protein
MIKSNCVQVRTCIRATLFLCLLCIFSAASALGQSGKSPVTATAGSDASVSKGTASGSQAAGAEAALRGLAEKNALTVRALVGYGRIPAADMAPLAGLRGKGIDVLGATPEQLGTILKEHGATLSPEERDSLGRVAEAMREAGAGEAAADSVPQETATDVTESAPIDDEALDAELAAILAEEVTEIPAQEDESEPSQDNAVARTGGVTFTASNVEPAALPPMKSAPFLDINALTPTQWDGAVAAAMEGMRMVYGPMSEADEESFRKTWGVLRQYPSPDAVDYLNKFNPLLGEFLSLRGAVAEAGARLQEAVEEIAWAAEADDPALAMDAMTLARQHRNTILSCQKRLDEVVAELVALGNPPDGAALMAEGQQQYKRAKDFLHGLMDQSGPEGEWIGYIVYPKNFVFLDDSVIKNEPYHFFVYAYGEPGEYHGVALDTGKYDEKEYNYVEQVDLTSIPGILDAFQGDTLNHSFTDEDGDTWTIHAKRYTGGPFPEFPDISKEVFEEARIKNDRQKEERLESAGQTGDAMETLKEITGANIGHALSESPIKEALAHYRMREAFHAAAVKWAAMGELPESEEARLSQFDALVAGGAPQQVAEVPAAAKQKPDEEKKDATEAQEPAVEIGQGDTPMHIVDDQPAEDRRIIDQEAIEFHSANVAIIQLNMDKDLAEAAKETNADRRHDLEMRVLNAKANLQSEQDRIESLKTGVIVHTRSEWDDFARSQFIQNIAADQRKMEKVDRAMKKALSMADTLPYDKAAKVREIVAKGFSPEVMTATDTDKASEVITEVYGVATGHWEGEKKKADADAEWADTCLQTAEMTKSAADKSLMVLSFIGGPAVNRVYQGTLGYIEGGPKEAFLRVGGSYNQLTGIAVDGYRGFEAAVESGGGWEEGIKGAGWEVAKGIVMDKAMGFVANGVSRGYGAVKGLKGAHADAPGAAPKASAGKTGAPEVQVAKATAKVKPAGVPDDGFNRPLTEVERQAYKEQIVDARLRVTTYKKTFNKLQQARRDKAPPTEIKKILRELDVHSTRIHASPQAKMMMKTHQRSPKNKEMVKRFVNSVDRVHNRVQKRFHEKMDAEWDREGLAPIRNAGSGKSVNTDYDIARQVKFDENGQPIAPRKNGRPVPESLWQAEAQKQWDKSFKEVTGQNPGRSWETVTTGSHQEAYKDLALIEKNGVLRANKAWAGQSADVNQYKGDHLRGDDNFSRIEKHVEIARSTSKECQKRLLPLMEAKAPPKTDKANYEAFMKHKQYWEKMDAVLNDMGSGRINPLEGDRRIRLLSGGKSSLEVTHDLRNFLESLIKFGKS